ncbi:MAG: ABC transporter substrate-binding protein [Aquisalimonadaceae bacterium]
MKGASWILFSLLIAATLVTAGQSVVLAQSGFAGSILIGDLSQRSGVGGGQALTESTSRGVEVAIREINESGGVKIDGDTYELAYKAIDSRSEPAATVSAARQLIGDGAVAAVLPSFATEVAYRALSESSVIAFGAVPRATQPLHSDGPERHPLLFGTVELAAPVIAGWLGGIIQQYPEVKRVAVLNLTDPTGRFMDAAVQAAAERFGLEYVGAQFVDPATTDFSTALTNLKSNNPDVIYLGTGAQILAATRQAIQLEAAPILWNYTMRPVDLRHVGLLGKATIVMADFRAPFTEGLTPPEFQEAAAKFGQLRGGEPVQVGIAAAYYDFVHLLAQAIEKAGSTDDTTAIAAALRESSYDGPFGRSRILPNQTQSGPIGLVYADASQITINVYPDTASTTEEPLSTFSTQNTWSR